MPRSEVLSSSPAPDLFHLMVGDTIVDTDGIPLITKHLSDQQRQALEQRLGPHLAVGVNPHGDSRRMFPKPTELGLMDRLRQHSHDTLSVITWAKSIQFPLEQPLTLEELIRTGNLTNHLPLYISFRANNPARAIPPPVADAERVILGLELSASSLIATQPPNKLAQGKDIYREANAVKKGSSLLTGTRYSCPASRDMIIAFTDHIATARFTPPHDPATKAVLETIHLPQFLAFTQAMEKVHIACYQHHQHRSGQEIMRDLPAVTEDFNHHVRDAYLALGYRTPPSLRPQQFPSFLLRLAEYHADV